MKQHYIFGVVGCCIGYSQSPEIFKAISDVVGFKHSFVVHDIEPADFDVKFPDVLKSGIDGFSVTIPHKKRVMPFMESIDDTARLVGAVNSVGVKEGRAYGYNTDSYGFAIPLAKHREQLQGATALIFGAGGAAGAIIHSLGNVFSVRRIYIVSRDSAKLEQFAASMSSVVPDADICPVRMGETDTINSPDYAIVVNCTPLGGWNHPDESPLPSDFIWHPDRLYYDLSYNANNKLIAQAARNGLYAYDGSAMLVAQALKSLELWTGIVVDFKPVYNAVFGTA